MTSKNLKILSTLILFTPVVLAGNPDKNVTEPGEITSSSPIEKDIAEQTKVTSSVPVEPPVTEAMFDTTTEVDPVTEPMFDTTTEVDAATFPIGFSIQNPRFTDNNNGTVTDNLTGLIWLKNANCVGKKKWEEAVMFVITLGTGTNVCNTEPKYLTDSSTPGDWRLPTVKELQSLIHYSFNKPALSNTNGLSKWVEGQAFSGVQTNRYWSSVTFSGSTTVAWYVNFDYGNVNAYDKTSLLYVWPVRSGQ